MSNKLDRELDLDDVNLNDISDTAPTIPAETYHMKIVEATVRESQDKVDEKTGRKLRYVNYRAVVQSGEYAGESVFAVWFLNEKSSWQMKRDLKRLGYEPADGVPRIADIVGLEGYAKVTEKVRKNRDTGQRDADLGKENSISSWLGGI